MPGGFPDKAEQAPAQLVGGFNPEPAPTPAAPPQEADGGTPAPAPGE